MEVLARFAPDGKPPCAVCPRVQAALHGLADAHVFLLNVFAHRDAFGVSRSMFGACFIEEKSKITRVLARLSGTTRLVSITPS
jgi:hypothetical protein